MHTNEEPGPDGAANKALLQLHQAASSAASSSSSRQWSAESRIVRVSRVFGGKDRHSKVRTVKGLRDRRVRLSVPTAIQLYDLQDRLGLSQPSKVVDWLLDAARREIDKLPPLNFPPPDPHAHLMAMAPPPFSATTAAPMLVDGDKAAGQLGRCDDGDELKGFMGLRSSLGLVSGAMTPSALAAHASPYHHQYGAGAEAWSNDAHDYLSGGGRGHNGTDSIQQVATAHGHGHSPYFPSLLSLAPAMSQFVFYSAAEGGFGSAMKEAGDGDDDDQFPVDNLDASQGQLSLSSDRSFLHSG
ncbi:transcription factor PCF6 [Brachypodium distachyon]|uniref:TCP domain-containing protein n=1 Tax=Brachypodium distachyon TaxID=15368 RepID=I1HHQ1_BRADI|nr:transcription factor PCF6 [Brachypodium distachyon]XP_010231175.1 transcription factor PCF6 [Brachypodium distachyon]KQK05440.1 hypothetical protein BRADI_2g20060v3 [Brachypodium distachyon]KQK05441.1 hypothetical protein BRADI_2g20060v3 [Brachypodium distachyon]PNT70931.1 hypothetical protein BRADI_2g20060v3 [Brachypodium distachyon]PNT70932.1 hypothetical protein BRADI_2g20060v3 [Brachypodium distachyon]|eukprot:XP_003566051.1 transcription factor PCF6 [Brachypodium distachyon]